MHENVTIDEYLTTTTYKRFNESFTKCKNGPSTLELKTS